MSLTRKLFGSTGSGPCTWCPVTCPVQMCWPLQPSRWKIPIPAPSMTAVQTAVNTGMIVIVAVTYLSQMIMRTSQTRSAGNCPVRPVKPPVANGVKVRTATGALTSSAIAVKTGAIILRSKPLAG